MALRDEYDFDNLVNETERLVLESLQAELAADVDGSICRCQDCILDMAAFALNSVRPMYRVSLIGKLYASTAADSQYSALVRQAVRSAIEKVKANPSH